MHLTTNTRNTTPTINNQFAIIFRSFINRCKGIPAPDFPKVPVSLYFDLRNRHWQYILGFFKEARIRSHRFSEWVLRIKTKKRPAFLLVLRAVGETRTRTGLLPLPPQSSVSTISPPPLCWLGLQRYDKNLNLQIFLRKISKKVHFFIFQSLKQASKTTIKGLTDRSLVIWNLFFIFARFSSGRKTQVIIYLTF